jgi:hypothetical protein
LVLRITSAVGLRNKHKGNKNYEKNTTSKFINI